MILGKITQKIHLFLKENRKEISLSLIVILISLLSFALGFISAKLQEKEPLQIEQHSVIILNPVDNCATPEVAHSIIYG
jgi:hypothetical protein